MKDIIGFEGKYGVTEDGRVWSYRAQKYLAGCCSEPGYPFVVLKSGKKSRPARIHRLVAEAYLPNPSKLPFVNHKNANMRDNRVENLEWCSPRGNVMHARRMGRMKDPPLLRGVDNNKAKLNEEEIREIRRIRKSGKTLKQIGVMYGVSFRTVWDIVTNRHWKHVA